MERESHGENFSLWPSLSISLLFSLSLSFSCCLALPLSRYFSLSISLLLLLTRSPFLSLSLSLPLSLSLSLSLFPPPRALSLSLCHLLNHSPFKAHFPHFPHLLFSKGWFSHVSSSQFCSDLSIFAGMYITTIAIAIHKDSQKLCS